MASLSANLQSANQDLLETYNDLNPANVEELYEEPSPLEFMRYVAKNRPFVVRRSGSRSGRAPRGPVEGSMGAVTRQAVGGAPVETTADRRTSADVEESELLDENMPDENMPDAGGSLGSELGGKEPRGDVSDWPAFRLWSVSYLKEKMGSQEVEVAVTPFGCVLSSYIGLYKTVYAHLACFESKEKRLCRWIAFEHWIWSYSSLFHYSGFLLQDIPGIMFLRDIFLLSLNIIIQSATPQSFKPHRIPISNHNSRSPPQPLSPFATRNLQSEINLHSNHQFGDARDVDISIERTVDVFIERIIEPRTATPTQLPRARPTVEDSL